MNGRKEALEALDRISIELMEGPKRTFPAIGYEIMSALRELSTNEEVEARSSDAARKLRAVNSEAQQKAARENGRKGGRPKGFIGWEYWDGRNTTIGDPNPGPGPNHGRLSIAGSAKMFRSKKERDEWVDRAPAGTIREAVSRTGLRQLMAGFTKENFDTYVESMEFDLDDESTE